MYKNAQNAILCTKMPRMLFFLGKIAFWAFLYITMGFEIQVTWYLCTNVHKYHIVMYKNAQNAIFYVQKCPECYFS